MAISGPGSEEDAPDVAEAGAGVDGAVTRARRRRRRRRARIAGAAEHDQPDVAAGHRHGVAPQRDSQDATLRRQQVASARGRARPCTVR
jgi:hypothetical protein